MDAKPENPEPRFASLTHSVNLIENQLQHVHPTLEMHEKSAPR